MPPSVTKKVSIEAARRARTTGSVADMFVQDGKQRVKKKVQKHRRKPKKPREHAQVVRIRESSDPVQAFFQEDVIVRRARTPLQRVLNMHIFHNLEDMVDGLTPADAFARAA